MGNTVLQTTSPALERLQGAAVDGRTENVRYRQDQLQSLHGALREQAGAVCSAIAKDTPFLAMEVEAEFYQAMDAVRHFYDGLDFDRELEAEYNVAKGRNYPNRRVGAGIVVIRPATHTRLYSILCPLAAAIAAGNCVVLELGDGLLQVDSTLRLLLPKALDPDTFCIISSPNADASLPETTILVDQTGSGLAQVTMTNHLVSSGAARCVAVVDRTADIELAAKAITTARFSFGGTSPYAPDLVLVNEYVKKDFFEACSRHTTSFFAARAGAAGDVAKDGDGAVKETRTAVSKAEEKGQVVGFGSSDFKLVDVRDRDSPIAGMKIQGPILPVATCSGLLDAAFTDEQLPSTLLAGYIFAEPRSAKYLSQHMACHMTFVNQIPAYLLVGPAAPVAHAPDYGHRYSRDMFSVPRPQFAEPVPELLRPVEQALAVGSGSSGAAQVITTSGIRALAVKPLKPTGQARPEMQDFFLTGVKISAPITLSALLFAIGYGSWTVGRLVLGFFAKQRL